MTEARARSFLDRTTALPSEVNASRTPPAYASGIIWVVQVATVQDVVTSPCQNGFHQLMNPSHHEPGNNVVSRNSWGKSGRFPIIAISSEWVPPRSKRSQERVPEQDFFGNIGQVSEHVGCIASHAGGVIEFSGQIAP